MSTKYEDVELKKYPYLGFSPNLLEYFLIIGYDNTVVQKEILPGIDEASKNKIEKSFNEIMQSSEPKVFSEYKSPQIPTILNSISSDYDQGMLANDIIINLSFPDPPSIYYSGIDNNQFEPNSYSVVFFLNGDTIESNSKTLYHGYTYVFYECTSSKTNKKVFIPKAFCIISQYPFFCLFNSICREVFKSFRNDKLEIPVEILLYNIVNFTPSPINFPLSLNLFPYLELSTYARNIKNDSFNKQDSKEDSMRQSLLSFESNFPMINPLPSVSNLNQPQIPVLNQLSGYPIFDFNLSEIFNILPIPTMVEVLIFNLLECEMLFFSKNIEVLNLVMYIISSLSYPCNDSIYLWHIVSVSKNEIVNQTGNSQFVGRPFSSMLGVNCTYNPEINTLSIYNTHFIVDLDNKKLILKYKNEEDEDEDASDVEKIKKLREYIKKILEERRVKSGFLEKIIKELVTELNVISKKVIHSSYNHGNQTIPKFFVTENNNLILNKNIQETFYNFVLNILRKYSSFYSLTSINDKDGLKETSLEVEGRVNISDNEQLNQSNPSANELNNSAGLVNISNGNNSLSNNSDISNEDNEVNNDIIKSNKPYFLKYHKSVKHFAEEEKYFCYLFKNSVKFTNYVAQFLKNYSCMALFKIPLIFSEEFIGLKNIDAELFKTHFFDIMDKFYTKGTSSANDSYSLNSSFGSVGNSFVSPQNLNVKKVNFYQFFIYYEQQLKKYFHEEVLTCPNIKITVTKAFKSSKYTYKYKVVELDKNILIKYIYHLSNLSKDKLEEIFPSIEIQKGNTINTIKARDIQNSIERSIIDYKTVTTRELLIYSILLNICICAENVDSEMDIENIFKLIEKEKYCMRKYLSMLLSMFYRLAERKININKNANIDLEFRCFHKTLNYLKKNKVLPDQQMMISIELFALLEKEKMTDSNKDDVDNDFEIAVKETPISVSEYTIFLKNNFCKDGSQKVENFLKLSVNMDYDGNLKLECDKCNEIISPSITLQLLNSFPNKYVDFYSPKKIYNESMRLCMGFFPEMDKGYLELDVMENLLINLIFYIDNMKDLEKSISKLLFKFYKKLKVFLPQKNQ